MVFHVKTKCTEMLGIEHPIVCGGMTATGSPQLAAAVSNAGGLGMLTCLHCRTPERLAAAIAAVRAMTDKPFGVNLTILGEKRGKPEFPHEFVKVIVSNKIRVVETCGSPGILKQLHPILREGGVEVIISKVTQIAHALVAQDQLGSDMVSLMGYDSGGLPGEADVGLFVQLALARKRLRIPFLASGGVATGEQLVAALSLGAAGVQIGTRFNASTDCDILPLSFKERMIAAGDRDTVMVMKPFRASSRVLKNKTAAAVLDIERSKGSAVKFSDVARYVNFDLLMAGIAEGDPDKGIWNCGQSTALCSDIPSVATIVDRIMNEAGESLSRLSKL
eukprot:Hpha_TRINITY_DN9566_c0_g1::TRINITY_DN9566_c0_g1_i1::g.114946::m.114946/K00459/ncd2, npd; nitronate monooxygenase